MLSFRGKRQDAKIIDAFDKLKKKYDYVSFVDNIPTVPWFPQNITDIDSMGQVLQEVKDQVNKDHPQFTDK